MWLELAFTVHTVGSVKTLDRASAKIATIALGLLRTLRAWQEGWVAFEMDDVSVYSGRFCDHRKGADGSTMVTELQ